jgi:hypothetical protein
VGKEWIEEEFSGVKLGDSRLESRLVDIVDAFSNYPEASIPQATVEWKRTKGSYRFFDNPKVSPEKILQGHKQASGARIKKHAKQRLVFAIQDTTEIKYAKHPYLKLGHGGRDGGSSLFLHATLLASEERVPLGVIGHQVWGREEKGTRHKRHEKKIEEKESYKWLKSIQTTSQFQAEHPDTHIISICDREGDIYDLFTEVKKQQETTSIDLLVRSAWDRRLDTQERLITHLSKQVTTDNYEINIPRSGKRKERKATLEVRYSKVSIKPPRNRSKDKTLKPVDLYVVEAKEITSSPTPIQWRLLTTYEITSHQDARLMLEWYTKRWLIEDYFKVLKSGCAIEERQLRSRTRLENCLVLDAIIAWRILFLTHIGRQEPGLPASTIFTEIEWKVLYGFIHKTPKPPPKEPSVSEVTKWLAQLGGFLARKGDGYPGSKVLWRGSWRLPDIISTWLIFNN